MDTARELGAPTIRIWAGDRGSEACDDTCKSHVVDLTRQAADLASHAGIRVAFEFHANTLTDTNESARLLLEAVDHPNVEIYWQPPPGSVPAYNLEGIDTVAPWLSNLHVFNWHPETHKRLPLAAGKSDWMLYLARVANDPRERYALIEFVQGDADEAFLEDAATLRRWLDHVTARRPSN